MKFIFTAYFFKYLLAFIVFPVIISCSKKIRLFEVEGISKALSFSLRYTDTISKSNSYEEQAKKLGLTKYTLYRFDCYPKSYLEFIGEQNIPTYVNYSSFIRFYGIDTLQNLGSSFSSSQIIFLLGQSRNGNLTIVADENRNNSFLDDTTHIINTVFPKKIPTIADVALLPTVRIDGIEEYYKSTKHKSSLAVILFPFIENNSANQADTTFHLALISSQYFTGTFKYKRKKYEVAVRNTMLPFMNYNTRYFDVKLNSFNGDSLSKNNVPTYHLGDSMKLGKATFVIKNISPFLEHITMKRAK